MPSKPQKDTDGHGLEPAKGQFLVYQTEDGQLKLDVRLEEETVWLTQPLMAELFQTTQQNISQHVLNVYEERELTPEATHKIFLSVRLEGGREVKRLPDYCFHGKCLLDSARLDSDFDSPVKQIETSWKKGGKSHGQA